MGTGIRERARIVIQRVAVGALACVIGWLGFPGLDSPPLVFGQNIVLTPALTASVGKNPESLTVGDFNGDEFPDLVTANSISDNVTLLFGNGNGTFRSAISFGIGKSPMSVASGDLNQDGIADLVVAAAGSDQMLVLLGKGNGLFQSPVKYATGRGPTFVAVKDLDRDRDLDVVVVNSGRFGHYSPFSLSVFLNQSDGRLGEPLYYETEDRNGMFPTGVSIEDLNADGWPDLAVTWSQPGWRTANGLITVLVNGGGGRFLLNKEIPAGLTLSAITAKDLDADGDQDLIATSLFSNEVIVVIQNEGEYFSVQEPLGIGFSPVSVAVEDLDQDGQLDIAVTNRASDSVSILLGEKNGSFHSAGHFSVGQVPTSAVVHDFDQDGRPDVITTNSASDDVTVLLSSREGIPSLAMSTEDLMFHANGRGGDEAEQFVRLSNVGLGGLTIGKVTLGGPDPEAFSVDDDRCLENVLTSGKGCTMLVHFISTLSGIHRAELTIWDNAPGGPRRVRLRGTREH